MTLSAQAACNGRQTLSAQAAIAAIGLKQQGRYGVSKSLDLLRRNIQSVVNRDIDAVVKKYLDKFFHPAIVNIRNNLGKDSVTEQHIRMVCIQMLEEAKSQYYPKNTHRGMYPTYDQHVGGRKYETDPTPAPKTQTPYCDSLVSLASKASTSEMDKYHNSRIQCLPSQTNIMPKTILSDSESAKGRKKVMRTVTSILPGTPTPIKVVKLEGIRREGPKWDPNRITSSTLFIMGARANKVLGFGQTRGRLYTKHPELLKYSGDTEDKEWLSRNNLMPPTGGIAYLLLLEDVKELAESSDYRNNANVLLHELKGFQAPEFMLNKIRNFIALARNDFQDDYSYFDPNVILQGLATYGNNGYLPSYSQESEAARETNHPFTQSNMHTVQPNNNIQIEQPINTFQIEYFNAR